MRCRVLRRRRARRRLTCARSRTSRTCTSGGSTTELAEALLADLAALAPDLVVVSGDLTQRARRAQFRAARRFLDRLPAPYVVVPGNHDIPLYDVVRRIFRPLDRYREHDHRTTSRRRTSTTGSPCSGSTPPGRARGRRAASRKTQIDAIRWLGSVDGGRLRVLVTHHPFMPPPGRADAARGTRRGGAARGRGERRRPLPRRPPARRLHRRRAGATTRACGRSIVVVQAGTAISNRRRGRAERVQLPAREPETCSQSRCAIAAGGAYAPLRTSRFARDADRLGGDRVSDAPLHVTNGDSVVRRSTRAGLPGAALSWIDVLYEGPVPAGLDAAGLAARARGGGGGAGLGAGRRGRRRLRRARRGAGRGRRTSCCGSSTTCTTSCSSCRCSTAWRPAGAGAGWRP